MAFTELADLDCETATALGGIKKKTKKANPTQIEGYYVGSRKVEGKKGTSNLHVFQTETEGNVGVWGKTNLDLKLASVTPGQMTRVTFIGMVETQNNAMYKYKVEVDKTRSIEVAPPSEFSADESGETSSYQSTDYEEDEASIEPLEEETVKRAVAPIKASTVPNATKQEKLQALLNGSRSKAS